MSQRVADAAQDAVAQGAPMPPTGLIMPQYVPYPVAKAQWPQQGRHILATYDDNHVLVYQAFEWGIAEYATRHQTFIGCPSYSTTRMTWIKPNFLWMMYRCVWARKAPNQARVLCLHLVREGFDAILAEAAHTMGTLRDDKELARCDVRLQWEKLQRRAIQLGLKGEAAIRFTREWVARITDITDTVVVPQHAAVDSGRSQDFAHVMVPMERVYILRRAAVAERTAMD